MESYGLIRSDEGLLLEQKGDYFEFPIAYTGKILEKEISGIWYSFRMQKVDPKKVNNQNLKFFSPREALTNQEVSQRTRDILAFLLANHLIIPFPKFRRKLEIFL